MRVLVKQRSFVNNKMVEAGKEITVRDDLSLGPNLEKIEDKAGKPAKAKPDSELV